MSIDDQVRAFHEANNIPILTVPQVPDVERVKLRLRLIAEEFFELLYACQLGHHDSDLGEAESDIERVIMGGPCAPVDLVEVADALADMDFINAGSRLEFGIPGQAIADEVARSNATKLGDDGKPVFNDVGKVIKGPNYEPPRIRDVLIAHGWEAPE